MEIIKSNSIAFAYTVKALATKDVTLDTYGTFFNKLDKLGIKVEYKVWEFDSKRKLHYHGILYLDKGFYRKRLTTAGMHMKLVELTDRKGWIKYIYKDQDPQEWPDDGFELDKPFNNNKPIF